MDKCKGATLDHYRYCINDSIFTNQTWENIIIINICKYYYNEMMDQIKKHQTLINAFNYIKKYSDTIITKQNYIKYHLYENMILKIRDHLNLNKQEISCLVRIITRSNKYEINGHKI